MTEAEAEISKSDKGEPNLISEPPISNGDVNEESEAGNLIEEEEETGPELVHNICILPPLQNSPSLNKTSYEDAIVLPPIQAFEPVGSIRAALSEVKGFAHLTNYHLIAEVISEEESKDIREHVAQKNTRDYLSLENEAAAAAAVKKSSNGHDNTCGGGVKKKKKKNEKPKSEQVTTKIVPSSQVVSPYTLKDAVVAVPSSHSSLVSEESESEATSTEIYLNDYGDLTPLVEKDLLKSNETAFRLVLERYDVGAIHDHVARFRNLCDGNAPYLNTLNGNESEEREEDEAAGGDKKNVEVEGQALKDVKQKEESADKQSEPAKDEKQFEVDPKELILPCFKLDEPISQNSSNLNDFYYYACGEDDHLASTQGDFDFTENESEMDNEIKRHKREEAKETQEDVDTLNKLDGQCHIKCTVAISGFNPPPVQRKLLGDLVYLEVNLPGDEGTVHVTAIPSGFYVNRSKTELGGHVQEYFFDPKPAAEPCFSHTLLDCLLLKSKCLRSSWAVSLRASLERSEFSSRLSANTDSPIRSLFRAAIRQDGDNFNMSTKQSIDITTLRPSWVIPRSKEGESSHTYDAVRAEETLSNTFGLDIRGGVARDWNEELQSAREMPIESLEERIERARLVHKTLSDFGDASVAGVKAICEGQITPMNPDESSRSHVYLHNNIFFSRAVDAGVDTFKISQGDGCARKAANRDANAVGMLHRTDVLGLHTLATVLIDFLGTRFVCQSIVPGILQGEKAHAILYGAVEAVSPLAWDKELHERLEEKMGKNFMIATRKVARSPLTDERIEYIRSHRIPTLLSKEEEEGDREGFVEHCGPLEMKGIKGSDQRAYCLDLTRLTPRDANWVPKNIGGTGKWEEDYNGSKGKSQRVIPCDLEDEEWIVSVLRPELVTVFTRKKMREWIESRQKKEGETDKVNEKNSEKGEDSKKYDDSSEYMRSIRVNLNVFLPNVRDMKDLDEDSYQQFLKDEELIREASNFLWDDLLPKMTAVLRENPSNQVPNDGRNLTEFLHRSGVNCRYLGRLATLAMKEETKDTIAEQGLLKDKSLKIERQMMPLCWLEMLECEMVARAAKHVLDRYLSLNGGAAALQPAFLVSSFLSAMMCTSEESAAETERRLEKEGSKEEDVESLSVFTSSGGGLSSLVPGRREVWADIEKEIGRRFRYVLHLYNNKDVKISSRALLIPLLRRVCQRTGVRLYANNYKIGGKGLCSAIGSYPISASDIAEIVPLVKHAANGTGEGFVPCSTGAASASSYLHILLPDASAAFEAAQAHAHARNLPKALDLVQETTSLYQRVVDSTLHSRISRCLDITAGILFQAQELDLARSNATKALAVAIQMGGFDCAEVIPLRTTLCHILLTSGCISSAVKHIRANMYLLELLAGPRHVDLSSTYQRLGTIYQEIGSYVPALRLFQEAIMRKNPDRVVEGMLRHASANLLATMGQFKGACEAELRATQVFQIVLGSDHEHTKNSSSSQKQYYKLAIQQELKRKEDDKKEQEEVAANAVASEIAADEAADEKKKAKKKKKKGKKKK